VTNLAPNCALDSSYLHRKLISTQDIRNVGRPFHNESVLGAVKWDPYFHFCEKENSAEIQLSSFAGFVCDQFSSELRT
jgi:hypothetical protein